MNKQQRQYCEKCNEKITEGEEGLDGTTCLICWETVCATSFWEAIVLKR